MIIAAKAKTRTRSKTRVAVLRGGPSNEYEVSLKTGGNFLKHLRSVSMNEKYEPYDVLITRDGLWHVNGFERTPEQVADQVHVALNALHGTYGEDGKVQQILDRLQMPYTGSGALSSAFAMNKKTAKEIARKSGIKTALYVVVRASENTPERLVEIFRTFPHPSVVKPMASGSSVGVSIVYTIADLMRAVGTALEHSDAALIEEYISGREVTCGIVEGMRGERLYALPLVEIINQTGSGKSKSQFFDYQAKYSEDPELAAREICPADFSQADRQTIHDASRLIHDALGLRHYSRADFIVSPRRGIYFLETNTLPGMTDQSLLPKSLAAVGVAVPDFLDHIISLALDQQLVL